MSDVEPLSIMDERPPPRGLSFNQKAILAALLVFVVLPSLLSGLLILLMILTGGPR